METIQELKKKRNWAYIEWADAYTPHINKWTDKDELKDIIFNCNIVNKVLGLVVHEDKKFITIVMQISDEVWDDGDVTNTKIVNFVRIPTTSILKRVNLNGLINK